MTQIDIEITEIKEELVELWNIVIEQLKRAEEAFHSFDKDLAREIIAIEKRVNSLELKLDKNCENAIALFSPVAMDLRLILAVLKINTNLERIADSAKTLAKFVKAHNKSYDATLIADVKIKEMFALSISMLTNTLATFEEENTKKAREILKDDEALNELHNNAITVIINYCKTHTENIEFALYVLNCIKKLERVGDHTKNVAEEIIFYIDAKILRHKGKKKK